jgi:2-haloacid dehalogenase
MLTASASIQQRQPSTALVFDFGGVLMDWNPRYLYRKLFNGDAQALERFLADVRFVDWNLEQDKGRPFAQAVAELSREFPQYADLIRAYDERWEESIVGPIQPMVDLLHALNQAGYPLYGLSNWSAEKFPIARSKYAFFDWFAFILVSGDVGVVKPDARIYRVFLEQVGRPAGECLFIDDSPANVAAAEALGFQAVRYESAAQVRRQLAELGLLPQNGHLAE